MASKDITVRLLGDATNLKKSLQDATKGIDDAIGMVNSITAKAAIGFGALTASMFVFSDQAKEAERAQMKLTQTLQLVGMETTNNTKILLENASAIARKSSFTNEEITGVQSQLLLYGVQGKALNDLTQGIVDYASFSGKDMVGASQRVSQAVDGVSDKVKGLNVNLKGVNGTQERAAVIANALRNQYAGFGETMVTGLGTMDLVKKQVGEVAQSIGFALEPAVVSINRALLSLLDMIQDHPGLINLIAQVMLFAAAFLGVIVSIGVFTKSILGVMTVLKELQVVLKLVGISMSLSGIGLAIVAISALVAAITWVIFNWDLFLNILKDIFKWVMDHWKDIGLFLLNPFLWAITEIVLHWQGIIKFFQNIWKNIGDIMSGKGNKNKDNKKDKPLGEVQGNQGIENQTVWYERRGNQDAVSYANAFEKAIKGNGDILGAIGEEMSNQILHKLVQGLMGGFFIALQELTGGIVNVITSAIGPLFEGMVTVFQFALAKMGSLLTTFAGFFKAVWAGMGDAFGNVWKTLGATVGPILQQIGKDNKGAAATSAVAWAYNAAIAASAAVAGVPLIGPALAVGAFAATLGLLIVPALAIQALSFAEGGMVPDGEGITKALSPNELVVPESFTSMIRSGDITISGKDSSGGGAASGPISVDMGGANFHGTFDEGMARMIGEKIGVGIRQGMIAPFPT